MDLYDVLIGEAPSDADKAAATAAALRRRRSFGELGVISGDRVLSNLGGRMASSADQYAEQIQNTRQKDIDNAQTKAYQSGQLGHMDSVLKESMRANRERERLTARGQDLSLEAAMARAAATGGKAPKLTVTDRRDLTEGAGLVGNIRKLQGDFKDDYAAPQIGGLSLPGARPLSNTISSLGLGTKGMDEAQRWWAESDRLYTLFQRNKLFGATLTSNEMKAWAEANTNKNMKPAQVKQMLNSILDIARKELSANKKGFEEGGYNMDQVNALTQRAEESDPAEAAAAAPEGGLTEEEAAELALLRKRFGGKRP